MVVKEAQIAVQGELATEGILAYSADGSERVGLETRARRDYFDVRPCLKHLEDSYLRMFSDFDKNDEKGT
jgi:hypothetical protein